MPILKIVRMIKYGFTSICVIIYITLNNIHTENSDSEE